LKIRRKKTAIGNIKIFGIIVESQLVVCPRLKKKVLLVGLESKPL